MEYEEYTKKYCDNCVNKDCTRIPINNDGSLIDKENPNICKFFKEVSEYTKIAERLEEVLTILKVKYMCDSRDGKCTNEDVAEYEERFDSIEKAISLVNYIGEDDLIKRDDVYSFLEYSCNSLQEAIDGLYEIDRVDLDYLDRIDIE